MLRLIGQSLWRSWREHALMQLATLVVLTGTFTVVSLFFFFHVNFTRILARWGESVQLAVFLKDAAGADQVQSVRQFLESAGVFSEVRFVSKEEAAKSFQAQMGHYAPQLLNDPEFGNPLPASLEARLAGGLATNDQYQRMVRLADQVARMPAVEDVSYGQGWIENYASLLKVFTSSSWILIAVLLGGSLLVVGNTVRNIIFQRREEIEVLELFGATPMMIRAPFILEGALLGTLSSALALILCFVFFNWQQKTATQELSFLGLAAQIGFLTWSQMATVLALGMWFGAMGSFLCIRQVATGWAAAKRD